MNFETVRIHFLSGVFVLLSSRNLAVIETWRNDFSSLLEGEFKFQRRSGKLSFVFFSRVAPKLPQSASESFNLGQNRWKICTPHPSLKSRVRKWRVLAFARLHPWFRGGWGFALPFLFCPRLLVSLHKSVTWFYCAPSPPYLENEKTLGTRLWCGDALAVGGGKFGPPYLNSVLSRQGS